MRPFHIFYSFLCLHIIQTVVVVGDDNDKPINFPPTIPITIGCFENWALDIVVSNLWIATPQTEDDVVTLANWAFQNGFNLRASGERHNWSPLTVTVENNPNVVLVDTTQYLTTIQEPTLISSSKYSVTTQTGATMLDLLTFLETRGLGMSSFPAPGDVTVGGVLAIGGHGTGVPAAGETVADGHALGTISNLVISFKAVVWDASASQFVLKTFLRSDVEAKAFLVGFGRIFIVEVTLMVGLNYNAQCESTTSISKSELFSLVPGPNAISSILDRTGRVETITFPFTSTPWLKVWTIKPTKPLLSIKVTQPFNYPFSNTLPESIAIIVGNMTAGAWHLTPLLGTTQLSVVTLGLTATLSANIWGPSKNVFLYVKPTTLRATANGYAVLTIRSNVQKVLSTFDTYYDDLVAFYQSQGLYPFNVATEIRVTSLDKPGIITGSEAPALSAIHPVIDHPEYDTAIWFDVLSIPGSPGLSDAMTDLETFIVDEFDGTYATFRPEWSKGWAYSENGAWSNEAFYRDFVPSTFPSTTDSDGWDWTVQTLDKYDPNRVFTNPFINSLLQVSESN